MPSSVVVILDVSLDTSIKLNAVSGRIQIDVSALDGSPESLDPMVIRGSSA